MKSSILLSFLVLLTTSVFAQAEFVENKGQWADYVQFRQRLHQGEFLMGKDRFVYAFQEQGNVPHSHEEIRAEKEASERIYKGHIYQARFENANPAVELVGEKASKALFNYYLGKDKKRWASGTRAYQSVRYENLYQGIEMQVCEKGGHLKYEFEVQPQVSPAQIQMVYEGVEALSLDNEGNLHLQLSLPEVIELAPIAYQMVEGQHKNVPCHYVLKGNKLSFAFPQGYDTNLPLTIDPTIVFSTLTGSSQDNWGFTAAGDRDGNAIGGGIIFSVSQGSTGFPTLGAYQTSFQGGMLDATVTKYDSTGASLIFSTYLGGSSDDQPHSVLTSPSGDVYVLGRSNSFDFPMEGGGFDSVHNGGFDIFLARFSATGALLASTFMGGSGDDGVNFSASFGSFADLKYNYGDDARGSLMVDKTGDCYVAMCSQSTDFPVTANAIQAISGGMQDGVVFKLNKTLTNLIFSTYIGGSANDAVYDLTLDESKNIFVVGGTKSTDFPVTANSLQPTFVGFVDGFIAKIDFTGNTLLASTYFGTTQYDQAYFVETDTQNLVYVYGQTKGNMALQNSVYGQSNAKQFVVGLDNNISTQLFCTTFGTTGASNPNISPTAFWVDGCQHLYVAGWGGNNVGGSGSSGTYSMEATNDAYNPLTDGNDFYFAVIDRNAQSLLYGTFFGGQNLFEHVDGGTSGFDAQGNLYQGMCAACGASTNFPTTPGAWSQVNNSNNCNLGVVKMNMYSCSPSSAISPNADHFSVKIYPNPSEGSFFVENIPPNASLELYNTLGNCVFSQQKVSDKTEITHKNLSAGLYWLKVKSEGKYAVEKVVIK
ncbi:MAG: T9SS type A sorting domain-containing protein [Bacteroidia bacterium]